MKLGPRLFQKRYEQLAEELRSLESGDAKVVRSIIEIGRKHGPSPILEAAEDRHRYFVRKISAIIEEMRDISAKLRKARR